jgi:hypothetical protein
MVLVLLLTVIALVLLAAILSRSRATRELPVIGWLRKKFKH